MRSTARSAGRMRRAVSVSLDQLPFVSLRPWLTQRYGKEVRRIALDAGSSCPNRDGTKGFGGCFYCDVEGSGTGALRAGVDLRAQVQQGLRRIQRGQAGIGAIVYLQSYSNTYVAPERLEAVLEAIEPHLKGDVVALSLATRPDTLPEWALDQLARVAERIDVWIELGLESADDHVLRAINRLHTAGEFESACARAKARGFVVVAHAILGLPGDGREGARRTANLCAKAKVDGVKVHQLMVLERTVFAKWWKEGRLDVLSAAEYVDWLADFLERLSPAQVVHRVQGDAPGTSLLAPRWELDKNELIDRLAAELRRRGTRQGSHVSAC